MYASFSVPISTLMFTKDINDYVFCNRRSIVWGKYIILKGFYLSLTLYFKTLKASTKTALSRILALWQNVMESASHLDVIKLVRFCRCCEQTQATCSSSRARFSTSSLSFCNSCLSELINIFSRLSWFANSAMFIHPSDVDCIMIVHNQTHNNKHISH